jgi:hypothetical protein
MTPQDFSTLVFFADFFEVDTPVPPLNTGRPISQMGSTEVFRAVCLGAALSACDRGMIGKTLDEVGLSLSFEYTHMLMVMFAIAVHFNSFYKR